MIPLVVCLRHGLRHFLLVLCNSVSPCVRMCPVTGDWLALSSVSARTFIDLVSAHAPLLAMRLCACG